MNVNDREARIAKWRVLDLDCPSCAAGVEHAVESLPEVDYANLDYGSATLRVRFADDVSIHEASEAIVDVVRGMGHGIEGGPIASTSVDTRPFLLRNLASISLWGSGGALAVGGVIGAVLGHGPVSSTLLVAATLIGLVSTFPRAVASLRRRSIDMNVLMTVAVVGALILGEFGEAATVVFLYSLGSVLENRSMNKTRESIRGLMDLAPQMAHVVREETLYDLMVEDVSVGDVVLVRPGERIPLDGIVRKGSASVDESALTGESVPALKSEDSNVYAGSLSVNGALEVEVTQPIEDSTLARIVELVEEAQAKQAPYQSFVDRFSARYTPIVVGIAAAVAVVPPVAGLVTSLDFGGFSEWVFRGLVLLVISCPCALVISTPVSIVSAITAAARSGVLVKGGAFLEMASKVTSVAYDKTGTLTRGRPEVMTVIRFTEMDAAEMLRLAAALESRSTHPLAHAIVQASNRYRVSEAGLVQLPDADEFAELAGAGVSGRVEDRRVVLGSPSHVAATADLVLRPEHLDEIVRLEEETHTVLLLAVDGVAVGLLAISDQVREESSGIIEQVRQSGIRRQVMLTGDNGRIAAAVSDATGVDEHHAGLLPDAKSEIIEQLRAEGEIVAMVGDGINDAPSLALADIGIAMGGVGSDVALQTADVVLMADDLSQLPGFLDLGRRTMEIVKQNVAASLVVKGAVLVLAVLGYANMWMAVFADTGIALLVILNGMRLLKTPRVRERRV